MIDNQKKLQQLYTDAYYMWQEAKKLDSDPDFFLEVLNFCTLLMANPPEYFTDNKAPRSSRHG